MTRPLTDEEQAAMELTKALARAMRALEVLHDQDWPETVVDIHNIQNRIMARPILQWYNGPAKPRPV